MGKTNLPSSSLTNFPSKSSWCHENTQKGIWPIPSIRAWGCAAKLRAESSEMGNWAKEELLPGREFQAEGTTYAKALWQEEMQDTQGTK